MDLRDEMKRIGKYDEKCTDTHTFCIWNINVQSNEQKSRFLCYARQEREIEWEREPTKKWNEGIDSKTIAQSKSTK